MIRRLLVIVFAAMAFLAAPAFGQDYPGPSVGAEVLGNGFVRVTGTGCPPGSDVLVEVQGGASAEGVADETGAFDIDVVIGTAPGTYTITVTCGDVVQVFTVTIPAAAPLPDTGAGTSIPMTRLGAVLVAAGGLAVYLARRRARGAVLAG